MARANDIGKIAESLIEHLTRKNGILRTPPDYDENGWDYMLEYTTNINLLSEDIKSFVQVKGFACDYKNYKGIGIKLSNIEKMIKDDRPWFIFYVEIKTDKTYILHFDETLMKIGYEKIKKANNESKQLHEVEWTINPNNKHNKDKVVEIEGNGLNLKEIINKFVSNGMENYSNKKNLIKKEIGYNVPFFVYDISLKKEDVESFNLGYSEELKIEKILNSSVIINGVQKDIQVNLESIILKESKEVIKLDLITDTKDFRLDFNVGKSIDGNKIRLYSEHLSFSIDLKNISHIEIDFSYKKSDFININKLLKELEIYSLIQDGVFTLKENNNVIFKAGKEKETNPEETNKIITDIKVVKFLKLLMDNYYIDETVAANQVANVLKSKEFYFLYRIHHKLIGYLIKKESFKYEEDNPFNFILPISFNFFGDDRVVIVKSRCNSTEDNDNVILKITDNCFFYNKKTKNIEELYNFCKTKVESGNSYNNYLSWLNLNKEEEETFVKLMEEEGVFVFKTINGNGKIII